MSAPDPIRRLFQLPPPRAAVRDRIAAGVMARMAPGEAGSPPAAEPSRWERTALTAAVATFLMAVAGTLAGTDLVPVMMGDEDRSVALYELVTQDQPYEPLEVVDLALRSPRR